ncbi:MAG: hypothetical protein U0Y96_03480 [Candidatus Kapaibacterium sp.]
MKLFGTTWIDNAINSYNFSEQRLGMFRIIFGLNLLITGTIPNIFYLASFPDSFFTPPIGPAIFFNGFPSLPFMWVLYTFTFIACVFMVLGVYTRATSLAYALLSLLGFSFMFSLGKISHNTGFYFLPMVLAFSDWGAAYSWDAHHRNVATNRLRSNTAVFIYALTLGWMFFTAGVPKLIGGWLSFSTQAGYGYFVNYHYVENVRYFLSPVLIKVTWPVFWEIGDWFTTAFELAFLWAAFRSTRIVVLCAIATLFHFFVLNTLNIPSGAFLFCYLLFADWNALAAKSSVLQKFFRSVDLFFRTQWALLLAAPLVGLLMVINYNYGGVVDVVLNGIFHTPDSTRAYAFIVELVGFIVALWFLFRKVRSLV